MTLTPHCMQSLSLILLFVEKASHSLSLLFIFIQYPVIAAVFIRNIAKNEIYFLACNLILVSILKA
jgi:hypothetical protein